MKIATRDIEKYVNQPDPRYCITLLYGQDSGLMAERAAKIEKKLTQGDDDPFAVTSLAASEVKADKTLLSDSLNAVPMLGGKRIVKLSGQGTEIKEAVMLAAEQMDRNAHLIVRAHDVNTRHALVSFCDKLDICASIGCYPDENRDLSQLIGQIFSEFDIQCEPDVVPMMISRLGADRLSTRAEIEKCALFAGRGGSLTTAHIDELLGDTAALQTDLLISAVLQGDIQQFNQHFTRVKREGIATIRLLRQLLGIFRIMQLAHLPEGRLDVNAVNSARPPLHFKMKPVVQKAISLWPAAMVEDGIDRLTGLEKSLKGSQISDGYAQTGQIYLGLALRARTLQRN